MKPEKTGWWYWPPIMIIRYWLLQGTLYMNWIERLHRWTIELLLVLCIYLSISASQEHSVRIILSFIIAHTLNLLVNGHLFAMFAHDLFWFSFYKDRQKFFSYIEGIRERLKRSNPQCLSSVVFFGSLVRGSFRDSSDLDIRFISKSGFWNAMGAAHWVFLERVRAVLAGFPIDVYMIRDKNELIDKIDVLNEIPVCLYRFGPELGKMMQEVKSFDNFKGDFFKVSD
ncbi:MAG: nucleotidyltransferase domain-containing protein [Desulfobacterales bacterium]|jgi:predicted nucleotidyltransferase